MLRTAIRVLGAGLAEFETSTNPILVGDIIDVRRL
jgi:hypothetical protein